MTCCSLCWRARVADSAASARLATDEHLRSRLRPPARHLRAHVQHHLQLLHDVSKYENAWKPTRRVDTTRGARCGVFPLYIQRQRLRQLCDRALIPTVNACLTWSVKPGSWRPRAWRTGALSLGLWSTWMRAVIVTTAGALVGALTPLLQPTVCAFYALLHV